MKGQIAAGGLIGDAGANSQIENSSTAIRVEAADNSAGGLVGVLGGGVITRSLTTGEVYAEKGSAGGLVGKFDATAAYDNTLKKYNTTSKIALSYTTGKVSGGSSTGVNIGGLVGTAGIIDVENSFSFSDVMGAQYVGGLVGFSQLYSDNGVQKPQVNITNCYAYAQMLQGASRGGLYGSAVRSVTASYYNKETLGIADASANAKTISEMCRMSTFAGWDLSQIWAMEEGSSPPYLRAVVKPIDMPSSAANSMEDNGSEANPYRIRTLADFY